MDEKTLPDLLRQFGLSDKEIDTYLTVLKHGEAKPSTIATEADISKRHVYSVSEQLESKGFVEVNSHVVPTTVRAHPPDEVIGRLQDDVEAMQSGLNELYREPEPSTEQISVVKSKATIIKRMQQLIREADSEITLSIPATHLDQVTDDLRAAIERDVLVVLIISDVEDDLSLNGFASVARTWEEVMPTILTVDSERGVFAPSELLLGSNSDRQGIVYVQEQLGPVIVGSFFGNYWPMTHEVTVTDPAVLPRTYTSFRHATLQAILHQRAGHEVQADVTGRWTGSGDGRVTITGRIEEIRQGLVRPITNDFPVEHSFTIDTGDELVSVGGPGAFVEEFEAEQVRLEER